MWVVVMKNVPNYPYQCQTAYSDSCFELLLSSGAQVHMVT